jgi:phosphopantothenoylcysteine decarboxylase/phosphopantothenate--cysteine ligase
VKVVQVETADQMLAACEDVKNLDLVICAAAVADWKVANAAPQKLKKNERAEAPALKFSANPDILKTLSNLKAGRARLVVGFAAETENVINNAQDKLQRKGCDLIIANDVSASVFGSNLNTVHLVSAKGVESWPQLTKSEVARRILETCAGLLK